MFQSLLNLAFSGPIHPLQTSSFPKTVRIFLSKLFLLIFSSLFQTPSRTAPTLATPTPTYVQEMPTLAVFGVFICIAIALLGASMVFWRVKDSPVFSSPANRTITTVTLYSPPLAQLDGILPSSRRSLADEEEWMRMKVIAVFLGLVLMNAGEVKGAGVIEKEDHGATPVSIVPALDSMPPTPTSSTSTPPTSTPPTSMPPTTTPPTPPPPTPTPSTSTPTPTPPAPTPPTPTPLTSTPPTLPPPTPTPSTPTPPTTTPPTPTPPTLTPPVSTPITPTPPRAVGSLASHKARVQRTRLPQPGDWVSPRTESVSIDSVMGEARANLRFNAELPPVAGLGSTPPGTSPSPPPLAATASTTGRNTDSLGSRRPLAPNWAFPEVRETISSADFARECMEGL